MTLGIMSSAHPQARRFILLSGGRTGSTYLLSLLASHPSVRQCGEIIGEWKLRDPDKLARLLEQGLVPHVQELLRPRPADGAVGAKILYYQLGKPYARHWGLPDVGPLLDYLVGDKDLHIIHLKRRNLLRVLASGAIAEKTQHYQLLDGDDPPEECRVELTPARCRAMFEANTGYIRTYEELFRAHPFIEVYYESLVVDRAAQCDNILRFLGLPAATLSSPMRRQNDRSLSAMISNYDELKAAFAGTPWEPYFA